jgi:hypothetical protein
MDFKLKALTGKFQIRTSRRRRKGGKLSGVLLDRKVRRARTFGEEASG